MARVRLWGYVASGARVLGAIGTIGGTAGGPGRRGGSGRAGGPATAEAEDGTGPFQPGGMAAPRALTRTELERLGWTGRQAGCEPMARHVQVADVLRRVIRGGDRSAAVTVRVAPGLPVVTGDARRLEAAVAGLVDHAIRRSRPGGRVLVRADVARGRRVRRAPGRPAPRGRDVTRDSSRDSALDATRNGGRNGGLGTGLGTGRGTGPDGTRKRGRVEIRISDRGDHELPEAREWLLPDVRADGPVGPALHSLVLAAGGRLAVEPTPGGGLTVVLLLTVAYD
ncbi:hypothetical protein BX285_5990 [Streptomyces sp. 1114.5]|uniref:hypothetical protein n=1 Tax=Streptomyces sp. 1114.5 TaxID=1938830 RepID=UPI000EB32BCE|nr:hypothetical protein [Streptomyces sp. 1114.5]RKT12025.1 hypothetical protein BX285_5990 [Streptomyces sp. 1114.5]